MKRISFYVALILMASGLAVADDFDKLAKERVDILKGSLYGNCDFTLGELLSSKFFSGAIWNYGETRDGRHVVVFKGAITEELNLRHTAFLRNRLGVDVAYFAALRFSPQEDQEKFGRDSFGLERHYYKHRIWGVGTQTTIIFEWVKSGGFKVIKAKNDTFTGEEKEYTYIVLKNLCRSVGTDITDFKP